MHLRHKYGCLIADDEYKVSKLDEEKIALKNLHYERASNTIYRIAKIIKHRASIYGIYRLND